MAELLGLGGSGGPDGSDGLGGSNHAIGSGGSGALGSIEEVVGDLLTPGLLEAAFEGVRGVYHIAPNVHPAEVEMGTNVISSARAAGVSHFVLHSVLDPRIQAMPHHWNKHLVEEHLRASGLGFTILQPASYMQNVRGVWDEVLKGVYPVPYPTDVPFSPVDLVDVAEVAAEVVAGSADHVGKTYELCGPERVTPGQMAAHMGKVLNRTVEAVEISRDDWIRDTPLDPERARTLLEMFVYYAENGFWGDGTVLEGLLGGSPTSFSEFLRRSTGDGHLD